MGDGFYFPEAVDVIADVVRETNGAELFVIDGSNKHGWKSRTSGQPFSFRPLGQMNHHTGPGRWNPMVNFIHHGSSIAPLANGMTSNPYETDGKVIVAVVACGRANHAGKGSWYPDVPASAGNGLLWGWEHHHPGDASGWHPLHREVILRLNVGMNLAFNWLAYNVPDHKDYAPGRKVDRAHESGVAWRDLIQVRMDVGHHSGHARKARTVSLNRIAGGTWFGTVALMNQTRFRPGDTETMYIVVRNTDEASRVAAMGAPWAEVERDHVPQETADLIRHFKPTDLQVLGGPNAVPGKVARECQRIAENA